MDLRKFTADEFSHIHEVRGAAASVPFSGSNRSGGTGEKPGGEAVRGLRGS